MLYLTIPRGGGLLLTRADGTRHFIPAEAFPARGEPPVTRWAHGDRLVLSGQDRKRGGRGRRVGIEASSVWRIDRIAGQPREVA
jgi:hypothetical protein